jgi:hypothetical protein
MTHGPAHRRARQLRRDRNRRANASMSRTLMNRALRSRLTGSAARLGIRDTVGFSMADLLRGDR